MSNGMLTPPPPGPPGLSSMIPRRFAALPVLSREIATFIVGPSGLP
jgi:hypothetical protein